MSDLAQRLRAAGFRGTIECEARLAPLTTWRIGGPAELLVRPADVPDARLALAWARELGLPWRVMGNGSNLLVRDAGVRGLVLRLRGRLNRVARDGALLVAGAGAAFPAVARRAAAEGLCGLEFGAGIPGTIGGALVMNAGWHEFEIGNHVEYAELLDGAGDVLRWDRAACAFGYRTSRLRQSGLVVLGAAFRLQPGDAPAIRERLERFARSRKASQPTELPSCGSVFLKPPGDFAGRLIEQAGLKGRRVGDVQVSPKHANFFVNLGRGSAADALALVEQVEREVAERFGVRLEREFELW
jgi:UDP-N-acetylmuramate dehydrogenase